MQFQKNTVAIANAGYENTKEVVKDALVITKDTLETGSSTIQYVTNSYVNTTMDVFKPISHIVMHSTNKLVTEIIPHVWNYALN